MTAPTLGVNRVGLVQEEQDAWKPFGEEVLVQRVEGRLFGLRSFTTVLHGACCEATCPVHILGPLVDKCPAGTALFSGITAASALCTLRAMLVAAGVKDAASYGTHDFRRGHALDLQLSGARLVVFVFIMRVRAGHARGTSL